MAGKSIVAKRLGEARMRSGLSQKKLGILAGMDEFAASPRINQYERGKHTPDLGTIERIAKVLGVPSAYFYAVEDDLAEWILAFAEARPAALRRCLRILAKSRSGS
jgi:transcriptional regulator with XRE-family HTH domain